MRNKIGPSQEESSVIICVTTHPKNLQPVRDEGRFPGFCRLRQMRNKIGPSQEESSVIICVTTHPKKSAARPRRGKISWFL
ncbi:hypothetical protein TNCV_3695731 [Trichonephila clavipes]|nr:hypothetical protein TNCV_3695731 [Trichonephila clavipes]